jgi:site-specific DNA-methyltransferase (adenine-specific)
MKGIKDNSIDLIVTDPPYKIIAGGSTNKAVTLKGANGMASGNIFEINKIKFADWLPDLYRVLKDGSHCYIMVNDRNMLEMLTECKKAKFKLLNILTWKKTRHTPNRYYLKNSEFIVLLRKGKAKNINNMGSFQVLEIDNVKTKSHPSEKPIELMKIFIENSSLKGEIVLDPFAGSGSTLLACLNIDRNFIGFELDKQYYELALERIKSHIKE